MIKKCNATGKNQSIVVITLRQNMTRWICVSEALKKHLKKILSMKIRFFMKNFNLFCIIKHVFTNKFFKKMLLYCKNWKIRSLPVHSQWKRILSVFDTMKLADYGSEIA